MEQIITLRIILEDPPAGVDFGLQEGRGRAYTTVQKQRSGGGDLQFDGSVRVKGTRDRQPDFAGPLVQGTPQDRFLYIDIGAAAGQFGSVWQRRLKIPLRGITWDLIGDGAQAVLETRVAGTARDGGPNCGTVKPFKGWQPGRP